MAQAGYTPIQLYYSTTTTNVPTSGNLASGELAINITDGKLFYKDNGGSVQVIAWKTTPTTAGGTGLTSWTAGDLPYYATGTTLSKLGIGTNGQVLTSTGTAPQWSTLSGVAVTTFSAGTTGFTPSSATSGAVTLAGTLATTNGGTGLTSFTANGVVYASSSSALTTGSALVFDGTNLGVGAPSPQAKVHALGSGSGAAEIRVQNTSSSTDSRSLFRTYSNASTFGGSLFMTGTSDSAYPTSALCLYNFDNLPLVFGVNNTEGARLTTTGLGIGTSSPATKLHLYTPAAATTLTIDSGTSGTAIAYSLAGVAKYTAEYVSGSNFYSIGRSGVAYDFVLSGGNVGIGTTSPAAKLDVANASGRAARVGGFQFSGTTSSADGGNNVLSSGAFWNGTNFTATQTTSATVQLGNGAINFYTESGLTPSGTYSGNVRATLDSSGNLGLGVTPSAWGGNKAVQVNARTSLYSSADGGAVVGNNLYYNGTSNIYIASNYATAYQQNAAGQHIWYNAPSGTAGNTISFTQAMTLDASGRLLVGATSSLGSCVAQFTDPNGQSAIFNTTNADGSYAAWFNNGSANGFIGSGKQLVGTGATSEFCVRANTTLTFATSTTERARITSAGTFQLTNNYQEGVLTANTGTAYTIDLVNGTLQILTLTGNCTFTFPTATAGQSFIMLLRQDATGGRTVTWPAAVRWPGNTAPTITSTASQTDKYIFTADGTRWYGSNAGQAYVA